MHGKSDLMQRRSIGMVMITITPVVLPLNKGRCDRICLIRIAHNRIVREPALRMIMSPPISLSPSISATSHIDEAQPLVEIGKIEIEIQPRRFSICRHRSLWKYESVKRFNRELEPYSSRANEHNLSSVRYSSFK